MDKYTLEFLSEAFRNHEIEYMASDRYNKDEFNLPKAFKTIVDEITRLQMVVDDLSIRLLIKENPACFKCAELAYERKLNEEGKSLLETLKESYPLPEKTPCMKQDK